MKTFLLGVGCQKGGTTWLHSYLHAHPHCDFGFRKEYHVFDVLMMKEKASSRFYETALKSNIEKAQQRLDTIGERNPALDRKLEEASLLTSFYQNPARYADYFSNLYDQNEKTHVVGDITPTYSGLTSAHLQTIKDMMERRGFHVKVAFLMRDPIERIYSSVRMHIRDRKRKKNENPLRVLKKRYKRPGVQMRTQYENTLTALDQSFDSKDVFYGFYETLFSEPEVRRLTEFLHIPYVDPDFDTRVNASPQTKDLTPKVVKPLRAYYGPTYEACQVRFGEDFIKGIWPHA